MIPTRILPIIRKTHSQGNYASYDIEPLQEGYGMTLGNALRRILLSSLPGTAITSIRIEGIRHELQTIPHVLEDVIDIVLNIKQLRLRCQTDKPAPLRLEVKGQGEVTAAQIVAPSTIQIVNPDLHIATLDNEQALLVMDLFAETGIGYVPAESNPNHPLGLIAVDAIYTPTQKVNYRVEHTRIGKITNYDKIVLEIWTDGTLTPERALRESALILADHFTQIALYQAPSQKEGIVPPSGLPIPQQVYSMLIENLKVSARTYHSLKQANINCVGQVLEMEREKLLGIKNFGRKSLDELYEQLLICQCLPSVPSSQEELVAQ